jgi:subtilisin-like proprotein convertase family protein
MGGDAMTIPTDTNFTNQWFLFNQTEGEFDLNVTTAWDEFTGAGVIVMVMDDGFDHANSDLVPNYDTDNDHDYGEDDDDAAPFYSDDNHGTSVMGIIGAAANGTGVVGVAYDATLYGARIDYSATSDEWRENYVEAFADAVEKDVGVINMSFGDTVSFNSADTPANIAAMKAAIADAVDNGRDGLGIALVKSAGNSRGSFRDVNHGEMDSDTRQIIVAAVDRNGFVSEYSSFGSGVLISAFGSPTSGQIWTTDRTGTDGYSDDDLTSTFNGTSAAAPMISGVVALMLQANADLGWRDIQSVLAYTARHTGSAINGESLSGSEEKLWSWNGATNWNGGAMHHSADYGYGLVDALAAVRLAETWQLQSTSANQLTASLDLTDATTLIPDGDVDGTLFSGSMSTDLVIERVTVELDFQTTALADLEVYIMGPDGVERTLIRDNGGAGDYNGYFTLGSQAYRGGSSAGDWKIWVVDDEAGDDLTVRDIKINVYGSTPTTDNTYIYTNDFSKFLDTHSTDLSDSTGNDTINASAVTLASKINLAKGTGTIDGVAITIDGIENVFTGDGKDTLTGDGAANDLAGGRGKDIVIGGKGDDSFVFNAIRDSLTTARDVIKDFGKGADMIDLFGIDAGAATGDQAFSFIGKAGFSGAGAEVNFKLVDKPGTSKDMTLVSIDLDGDKVVDWQIQLTGLHKLGIGDFVL